MLKWLNCVGPPRPMGKVSTLVETSAAPRDPWLDRWARECRLAARAEEVGAVWPVEPSRRSRSTRVERPTSECLCQRPDLYHVPAICPACGKRSSARTDEYAETRAALLRGEIPLEYTTNSRIIAVR